MDKTPGYSKYVRNTNNSKKVKTSLGQIELDIPRDRNGEFELQIVPKHSRDISYIEIYGRAMSTSDINEHLQEIYGLSKAETARKLKKHRSNIGRVIIRNKYYWWKV